MPDDFKAFTKMRVDNHLFNKWVQYYEWFAMLFSCDVIFFHYYLSRRRRISALSVIAAWSWRFAWGFDFCGVKSRWKLKESDELQIQCGFRYNVLSRLLQGSVSSSLIITCVFVWQITFKTPRIHRQKYCLSELREHWPYFRVLYLQRAHTSSIVWFGCQL